MFDLDKLALGNIAFGANSWRGDHYEPLLRDAIVEHRQGQSEGDCQHAESGVDIHELLAKHRHIAAIWGIEDVQSIRPDLSEEQAWEVLQQVDRHKDAELGITWLTLELAADDLFGDAPETDRRRRDMGNRACIVFFDRNRVSPTVYLHWHGDAVPPGWTSSRFG